MKVKDLDKFLNKIIPTFCHDATPCNKDENLPGWMTLDSTVLNYIKLNHANRHTKKYIKLLYGNWGKSPNLKGSKPTPGIGLRRKIENFLKKNNNNCTVTQTEEFTSKTCPCCRHRSLDKADLANTKCHEKHHLLRCTNVNCKSRWWNRDVAGSFNILYRGIGKILEFNGILDNYVDFVEVKKPKTIEKHS